MTKIPKYNSYRYRHKKRKQHRLWNWFILFFTKNKKRDLVIALVCLCSAFIFINRCQAGAMISNSTGGSQDPFTPSPSAIEITGVAGTANQILIKTKTGKGGLNVNVQLTLRCKTSEFNYYNSSDCPGWTDVISDEQMLSSSFQNITFTFATTTFDSLDNYYEFVAYNYGLSGYDNFAVDVNPATSTWPHGTVLNLNGTYHQEPIFAVGTDLSSYSINPAVTLYNPFNGQTILTGSVLFNGGWEMAPGDNFNQLVYQIYTYSTTTGLTYYTGNTINISTTTGTFSDTKTLPTGEYQWQGYLYNSSSTAESPGSSPADFTVSNNSPIFDKKSCQFICTADTSTNAFGFPNSPIGVLKCGLEDAGSWAFCPDQSYIDGLSGSFDQFKHAFPFNAFYDLTGSITGAISSTTLGTSDTFGLPMIRKTSTGTAFYILPVLNASSTGKLVGNNNAQLIKNSIGWVMWACVGFLVFIQFKSI